MGKITSLRDIVGIIKDKASQSRAAIVSSPNPRSLSLQLALLKATSHDPLSPPSHRHIDTILSFGRGSRATASSAVEALMDRLQTTRNACVALKCLIVIHYVIKRGTFILQDQLSVYPSAGGRNYLKLCGFRDGSSPLSWEISSWVRWYSLYLEEVLSNSRILGFMLSSTSSTMDKETAEETISCLMNADLFKEMDSLVRLLEHTCQIPEPLHPHSKALTDEVHSLVGEDYLSALNEVSVRVNEMRQRLRGGATFGDSIEFAAMLRRLEEECKAGLSGTFRRKRAFVEGFWGLVSEVKGELGGGGGEMVVAVGKRGGGSESARFGNRVLGLGNSVQFGSCRFSSVEKLGLPVLDFS